MYGYAKENDKNCNNNDGMMTRQCEGSRILFHDLSITFFFLWHILGQPVFLQKVKTDVGSK